MQEKMNLEPSQRNAGTIAPLPSTEFLETLKRWLAVFAEHYRQEISELSTIAYIEGLRDMTVRQLNLCCERALKVSPYMPVVATIREQGLGVQYSDLAKEEDRRGCEACSWTGWRVVPRTDGPGEWARRCECSRATTHASGKP
jgi:hypothetical protein